MQDLLLRTKNHSLHSEEFLTLLEDKKHFKNLSKLTDRSRYAKIWTPISLPYEYDFFGFQYPHHDHQFVVNNDVTYAHLHYYGINR